jgi:glucose/arabinose dehydrogenase
MRTLSSTARRLVCVLALVLAPLAGALPAAELPAGFTETAVAKGLRLPTALAIARDGRVFVAEQGGTLRVIARGKLQKRPFVGVQVDARGERGLLGVALHPDFPATPFVYVYYTATKPVVHNRVSRFTARGNRVVRGSEVRLLDLPPLGPTNHNGGGIHFGPDGMLYVGVGENASAANAQSLETPLGKLLRITPTGGVPADNPFLDRTSGLARAVWALGLRNPYTFAFAHDGRLYINDVGQSSWEEINPGVAGANYGWPLVEGPFGESSELLGPVFAYGHGDGPTTGCAITGGAFYEATGAGAFPAEMGGSYFFADLCSGWIRRLPAGSSAAVDFASGVGGPVDLAVGPDKALYYVGYGEGRVVKVTFTGP